MVKRWQVLFIHLRLHFQLLLAPIFLCGVVLSGGAPGLGTWVAFCAFHIFLYGGTTAFNSYYDRDEGPVGGLVAPPPVIPALLPFSLVWQGFGLVLTWGAGVGVRLLYLLIFLAGAAYSHPAIRWKQNTWAALLTVALGQGVLGFWAGWLATDARVARLGEPLAVLGAVATALLITGFYPISQVYQVEEDQKRGDITLAVRFGPKTTLWLALGLSALGGVGFVAAIFWRFGWVDALVVGSFYLALAVWVLLWGRDMTWERATRLTTFYEVMRLAWVNATCLMLYLGGRLLLNSVL